eukprot:843658-Amorphochlora_amoeboformis.AAC.1
MTSALRRFEAGGPATRRTRSGRTALALVTVALALVAVKFPPTAKGELGKPPKALRVVTFPFKQLSRLGVFALKRLGTVANHVFLHSRRHERLRRGSWVVAWMPLSEAEADIESCEVCQVSQMVEGAVQLTRVDGSALPTSLPPCIPV